MSLSLKLNSSPGELTFQHLFHDHPLPMFLYDLETLAFLDVNAATVQKYGYTRAEFLSMTIKDIRPVEDVPRLLDHLAQSSQPFQPWRQSDSWRHRLKNGRLIDVEISSHALTVNGREAVLVVVRDVTERKRTEKALKNLNRAYSVVSAINQTIVRGHTPQVLFQAACTIAVEQGGFRMAWLGWHDPRTGEVRPVASAGLTEDYVEKLGIVLDDSSPAGRGPVANAVRTGQHVVVNDIEHEPCMASWREDATRLGYGAIAAFPLIVNGIVQGAFNLYAAEPQFFDAQELHLFDEVARDISFALEIAEHEAQRKRMEEALFYQANLLQQVSDAIIATDPNFNITSWNQAAEALYGWSAAEVIGRSVNGLLETTYSDESPEQVFRHFLDRGLWQGEAIQKHKNGEKVYVLASVSLIKDSAGQPVGAVAVNRDITERKLAEEELRESEEKYRIFFQSSLDAILLTSPDGSIQAANPAACKMLGRTEAEICALGRDKLVDTNDPRLAVLLAERLRTGKVSGELTMLRNDGSPFPVEISSALFKDRQGNPRTSMIIRDITERKQAEAALKVERASLTRRVEERTAELSQANAGLTRALRAKDEFLAAMSHELRTPLNAILGNSEVLQEQVYGSINDRQLKSVQTIEQSGRHLLALINDILDLAKVEAGKLELQLEPVSVTDLCQASLVFVKETAAKKNLHLSFCLKGQPPVLQADARRLKQILVNLLSNAVKFTPAGGQVSLEVMSDPSEGVIRFVVQDSGIGITAEDMAKLFQPFTQVDARLSRQFEGSGLGLALVRRLADLHGGSVTVESAGVPGLGSRFTVSLPWPTPANATGGEDQPQAKTGPLEAEAISPPSLPSEPKKATVLLVEDNDLNIEAIGDYLKIQGYPLVVAHHGNEALQRVEEITPDLILMDIQIPEMDGLQVTRLLRIDPRFVTTPIIALTALAMPGDRERCLAAGANEYLTKPVSLKQLIQTMESLLAREESLAPPH